MDPGSAVAVSAVTAWETATKAALGTLAVPDRLTQQLHEEGCDELPVTVEDGVAAAAPCLATTATRSTAC